MKNLIAILLLILILSALPIVAFGSSKSVIKNNYFDDSSGLPVFSNAYELSIPSDTLADIESWCTDIVRLEILPGKTNIVADENYEPVKNKFIKSMQGTTQTKARVIKVYKGNLKNDDEIIINENYFRNLINGEEAIFTRGDYSPAIVGNEYIFFLKKFEEDIQKFKKGTYIISFVDKSKYLVQDNANVSCNINDIMYRTSIKNKKAVKEKLSSSELSSKIKSLTAEELNTGEEEIYHYKTLYQDVLEKYN